MTGSWKKIGGRSLKLNGTEGRGSLRLFGAVRVLGEMVFRHGRQAGPLGQGVDGEPVVHFVHCNTKHVVYKMA